MGLKTGAPRIGASRNPTAKPRQRAHRSANLFELNFNTSFVESASPTLRASTNIWRRAPTPAPLTSFLLPTSPQILPFELRLGQPPAERLSFSRTVLNLPRLSWIDLPRPLTVHVSGQNQTAFYPFHTSHHLSRPSDRNNAHLRKIRRLALPVSAAPPSAPDNRTSCSHLPHSLLKPPSTQN